MPIALRACRGYLWRGGWVPGRLRRDSRHWRWRRSGCERCVVTGANAIAGEWGHNPLPWPEAGEWPGPPCDRGRQPLASTRSSVWAGPRSSGPHRPLAGRRRHRWQRRLPVTRMRVSRSRPTSGVSPAGSALVVNVFDPDAIVPGGGVLQHCPADERAPRLWAEFVFSDAIVTWLVRAVHGDSSGVRGAAWLWD